MDINETCRREHHEPDRRDAAVFFGQVLRALHPACEPFVVLRDRHMAKAILTSRRGGHPVILHYDPRLSMLSMVLELGKIGLPAGPRFFTIPQARTNGHLTSATICGEDGTAWLRTASLLCPSCREPRHIVRSLVGDLLRCVDGQASWC